MISTISMVHAPSKLLGDEQKIADIPDGTLSYDVGPYFTIKVAGKCVIIPDISSSPLSNPQDYSTALCTNNPYPTGTIIALTQE